MTIGGQGQAKVMSKVKVVLKVEPGQRRVGWLVYIWSRPQRWVEAFGVMLSFYKGEKMLLIKNVKILLKVCVINERSMMLW